MRITVLAGGIGGARFLRGLKALLASEHSGSSITVIGNTGDDIWVHGLRVCPDLDTVMYTLGGGISDERGWGREGETFTVKDELASYGVEPGWFGLGDKDIATHLVRTQSLAAGYTLTDVTTALCDHWQPGVRLLPMSDDRAETHVIVERPDDGSAPDGTPLRSAIHFQEWWIRYRAALPTHGFTVIGIDTARPGPDVIKAISTADVVLLPPSNPVVSIGTILQVPGIAAAVRATHAPVVGVSPIVGGAPVRGMADACLAAIGVETSAFAVAEHYGARSSGGLIDAWLVDSSDADCVEDVNRLGIDCRAVPAMMTDVDATARLAAECLAAAETWRARP
ncbi:MAG: 2-phospho-L-lactate transferase [Actinobacteria bacterium]|nr:2-phospho-L-lactate transferase [Actinomycetota bacterium]